MDRVVAARPEGVRCKVESELLLHDLQLPRMQHHEPDQASAELAPLTSRTFAPISWGVCLHMHVHGCILRLRALPIGLVRRCALRELGMLCGQC